MHLVILFDDANAAHQHEFQVNNVNVCATENYLSTSPVRSSSNKKRHIFADLSIIRNDETSMKNVMIDDQSLFGTVACLQHQSLQIHCSVINL